MGRRIEILILLFTGILIAAVLTVGSMLFSNLQAIEKHSQKIYEPNKTIIHLKSLLSELRNSENCIKSYSLYNNADYLLQYQGTLEQIDRCFDSLYLYQKGHPEASALLDSTENLVEQKILLMNKQLSLRNEDKVVDELNTIRRKLDKVVKVDTTIVAATPGEAPKKKRNFFSRLFGKKESPKTATDSIHVVLNKHSIDEVKTEVAKVKRKQVSMFAEMKNKELALVEEDKRIWGRLINILSLLEQKQNEALREIAKDNIGETDRTHNLTTVFGACIVMLLIFLALLSIYYFNAGRKYRKELKNALEETRVHAKARDTFLATMSHEMRTPLNAITGFTEQLQASPLNEEHKKQVDIVHSASKHLLNLINDVLDLSKIESEKINFEKIAFSPREQIEEAVKFLNPKVIDKGLSTELTFDDTVPDSVIGDPLRLKQVILNLLGNSIKFTSQGGIRISVSATRRDASNKATIIVILEDTGIGIAEHMIDKIFDNFTQADSSIIRKYGGTGLGLSITKKIIELQNGDIKLESKINKGTRVTFRIPYELDLAGKKVQEPTEEKYMPTIVRGKKVLIADDELFNRVLLTTILKRWDIQYDQAENGNQVLDMVQKNDYDVVLMDVRMPEVSGIDATKQIRKFSDKRKANVPIIALTAAVFEEKRKSCMEAGMNGMITKPFKEAELLKLIETILIKTHENEKV
ncbi:MAG: luxQ 1 [Bacteroidetes bacterium]|nr:luxQ 1 [Bacteroidota bacterium]